jgi:hypothetical protein
MIAELPVELPHPGGVTGGLFMLESSLESTTCLLRRVAGSQAVVPHGGEGVLPPLVPGNRDITICGEGDAEVLIGGGEREHELPIPSDNSVEMILGKRHGRLRTRGVHGAWRIGHEVRTLGRKLHRNNTDIVVTYYP